MEHFKPVSETNTRAAFNRTIKQYLDINDRWLNLLGDYWFDDGSLKAFVAWLYVMHVTVV